MKHEKGPMDRGQCCLVHKRLYVRAYHIFRKLFLIPLDFLPSIHRNHFVILEECFPVRHHHRQVLLVIENLSVLAKVEADWK